MIREDYIIGWIKRYIRWLAEIAGMIRSEDYESAARRADLALRELLGLGADSVLHLTDGEILARLAMGETEPAVRDKCLIVAALLFHVGQTAAAQHNSDLARDCWLKSLQIVLGAHLQGAQEMPEYAPTVETLVGCLKASELPPRTEAALVLYHEQRGAFDRAEDALFRLLDSVGGEGAQGVIELGRGFYQRLSVLSDEALAAGNFSRPEVPAGLDTLLRGPAGGTGQRAGS